MDAAARLTPAAFPVATLLVCAAAVAVYGAPALQALLIYDRAAVDGGELWRLMTGNLVHYSTPHLGHNMMPLLIAGALIEAQRIRHLGALCALSAALIGAAVYWAMPEIAVFAGLSGIVTAMVTFLCLHGLGKGGAWRWLCLAVLICLGAKVGAEMGLGTSFLAESGSFVTVPESHAIGAAAALMLFLWSSRFPSRFVQQ